MKQFLLILAFAAIATGTSAQTIGQIEDKIVHYLTIIKDADEQRDTLNAQLVAYIKDVGARHPEMLKGTYKRAEKEGLRLATSADGKMRIYCWDSREGGTMHIFYSLLQYAISGGSNIMQLDMPDSTKDGADPGRYYKSITCIKAASGKVYYMVIGDGIYSTKDVSSMIKEYTIDNNKLNDSIKIFKTKHKALNAIDYFYDYFSNYNPETTKENNIIHFSADNRTLYIPVVLEDKVTNRNLVYKFDGEYYVFDKNGK